MLLDAAETTLGIFGFDLRYLENQKTSGGSMRRNRMNDVQAEVGAR